MTILLRKICVFKLLLLYLRSDLLFRLTTKFFSEDADISSRVNTNEINLHFSKRKLYQQNFGKTEAHFCYAKWEFINTFVEKNFERSGTWGWNSFHLRIEYPFVFRSTLSRYWKDLQIGIIAQTVTEFTKIVSRQMRDNLSSKVLSCLSNSRMSRVLLSIFLRKQVNAILKTRAIVLSLWNNSRRKIF